MLPRSPINTKAIQKLLADVPRTYEMVNHTLTLGLDLHWRRRAAKLAARAGAGDWVDMCTGTGELAHHLDQLACAQTRVLGLDLSAPMLSEAIRKRPPGRLAFAASDVRALPLPDCSVDLITMSFATRNLNYNRENLERTFREYHRVLKPGGRFVNLETSQPQAAFIRNTFHLYVRLFVKVVGTVISGSHSAYGYLAHTIPRFYPADQLAEILRAAGFSDVSYETHLLGVVAIHAARRA